GLGAAPHLLDLALDHNPSYDRRRRAHVAMLAARLGYVAVHVPVSASGSPGSSLTGSSFTVAEVAQDHLEELAEQLHESCSASVLDGEDIVYVARSSTNRIMTIGLSVGTRLPAHCTSMGRVLLAGMSESDLDRYLSSANLQARTERTIIEPSRLRAELDAVRAQGWALLDQELEEGVRSVAVPVRDTGGHVVAAINTSAHATRVTLDTLRGTFLPALRICGQRIENDLAGRLR
ncbi:MAG: IclR family transcriptional regulator C-terminal domain-containing protein, partial [Actinomycetales bacterium]